MGEDESSRDRIDQIVERLDYLERLMRDQLSRLYAIENQLGLAAKPSQSPELKSPPIQQTAAEMKEAVEPPPSTSPSTTTSSTTTPSITTPSPAIAASDAPQASAYEALPKFTPPARYMRETASGKPRVDLESRIGGSWFNRIGIIAICFGVAFFLKYAFENEWIGPTGRVLIGFAIGIGFLAAGERLRARYASYAYGLSGGGILILYLSVFAAFARYALISHLLAFILMAGVTMTAALLAARYSAQPIAVLGLIGGFLTPILLSTGVDNQAGLFGYIALLDAGVLALAYSKQWRSLNYMAFAATVLMFAAWMLAWYAPSKLWTTIFFLTLFFVIFALLAVLYNVINRRPTLWLDLIMVFLNALLYFSASYELLDDYYRGWLGLFAVMMSAFHLALGYFAYSRDREDTLLIFTFLGLAFLFLVLAVPIQLDQHWVTMGWAIEGAVMTWVGLRVNDRTSRYAALVVFAIAVAHWGIVDAQDFSYQMSDNFVPLLNSRAFSGIVLIAALAIAAWFYSHYGSKADPDEQSLLGGLYLLAANAMAVTLLSMDANDYFEKQAQAGRFASNDTSDYLSQLDSSRQFTLTALWTVYGAIAVIVGITRRLKPLRIAALALLAMAIVKALIVNLEYYDASWHKPVFNQTFASFALLIAALALTAWYYARAEHVEERERRGVIAVILAVANSLAIVALSAEASGYFEVQMRATGLNSGEYLDLQLARQLSLSVIWMIYGGVMLTLGIARRSRLLRLMALLLLSLTILKVFFIDLSALDRIYRIISFIVLGAILLAVSFLYQRYKSRVAELIENVDAKP